eukprot:GHVO01050082.1.p1 GENE.GHVO01050082.1~~GHVO01050082.1.p1  ORF type:complete len:822 (+),score=161.18 GHVO01050082.1:313-2466(+)
MAETHGSVQGSINTRLNRRIPPDTTLYVEVVMTNPLTVQMECVNLALFGTLEGDGAPPSPVDGKGRSIMFHRQALQFRAQETRRVILSCTVYDKGKLTIHGLEWDLFGLVKVRQWICLTGPVRSKRDEVPPPLSPALYGVTSISPSALKSNIDQLKNTLYGNDRRLEFDVCSHCPRIQFKLDGLDANHRGKVKLSIGLPQKCRLFLFNKGKVGLKEIRVLVYPYDCAIIDTIGTSDYPPRSSDGTPDYSSDIILVGSQSPSNHVLTTPLLPEDTTVIPIIVCGKALGQRMLRIVIRVISNDSPRATWYSVTRHLEFENPVNCSMHAVCNRLYTPHLPSRVPNAAVVTIDNESTHPLQVIGVWFAAKTPQSDEKSSTLYGQPYDHFPMKVTAQTEIPPKSLCQMRCLGTPAVSHPTSLEREKVRTALMPLRILCSQDADDYGIPVLPGGIIDRSNSDGRDTSRKRPSDEHIGVVLWRRTGQDGIGYSVIRNVKKAPEDLLRHGVHMEIIPRHRVVPFAIPSVTPLVITVDVVLKNLRDHDISITIRADHTRRFEILKSQSNRSLDRSLDHAHKSHHVNTSNIPIYNTEHAQRHCDTDGPSSTMTIRPAAELEIEDIGDDDTAQRPSNFTSQSPKIGCTWTGHTTQVLPPLKPYGSISVQFDAVIFAPAVYDVNPFVLRVSPSPPHTQDDRDMYGNDEVISHLPALVYVHPKQGTSDNI